MWKILYLTKYKVKVEVLLKHINIFDNLLVEDKTMHITTTFYCHTKTKSVSSLFYQGVSTLFKQKCSITTSSRSA